MYLIYQNGEVAERAEDIRYIKRQENGVTVLCAAEECDAVHSPGTDRIYPIEECSVEVESMAEEIINIILGVAQ